MLLLLDKFRLNQALYLGWTVLGDISNAFASRADEPFECQVVASSQRIVLVGFNVTTCVLFRSFIKLVLLKHDLQLFEIDWDGVFTNYDARVVLYILDLLEPDMGTNITCFETLCRVCIKDFCNQISAVRADEIRDSVVSVQDFLVQHVSFWVFKRQISADHSVEDDTTRPDVGGQAMVVLTGDHLRRSIARTATRRLQGLPRAIGV